MIPKNMTRAKMMPVIVNQRIMDGMFMTDIALFVAPPIVVVVIEQQQP